MSSALPKRVDLLRLARERAVLDGEYRLAELPRLSAACADSGGVVRARIALRRQEGAPAEADLRIQAAPVLVCQRCLEPVAWPLDVHAHWSLVREDRKTGGIEGREPVVVEPGDVSLADLIEDELLLALPLVPAHAPERCPATPVLEAGAEAAAAARRAASPFAVLETLGRGEAET